ncbi:MAG TPA: dihydroneopterin aldolase, partial [Novosphingobium sp.]|nr:dihydroneopterin aldolase [Novosphingobium sp.]
VIWTELGLEHGSGGGIDRLEQTVDYRAIAMAASDLAATHIDLIETFAHRLAQRCMAMPVAGGRVAWARVRLDKPEAVDNGLASVSVHLRAR